MRSLHFRELITVFFPSFPSYYFNPYNNEKVLPQPPQGGKTRVIPDFSIGKYSVPFSGLTHQPS